MIELKKDLEESSHTVGNYWLRCINIAGNYSNELFTIETVLMLKKYADKQGYTGHIELHNWFMNKRPAIYKSSITEADPHGLIDKLIDILKNFEL
jgi:hypothetical protein